MRKFLKYSLLGLLLLMTGCDYFKSDYDLMIESTKKVKLAEESKRIKPKVYDGYLEPLFPNENENNIGLFGVDSNNDGIRDDVEIWINRNADSDVARVAFKDYYRKNLLIYEGIANHSENREVINRIKTSILSGICLGSSTIVFGPKYIKTMRMGGNEAYEKFFERLFENTSFRRSLKDQLNTFDINNLNSSSNEEILDYCDNLFGKEINKEVKKKSQSYFKTMR